MRLSRKQGRDGARRLVLCASYRECSITALFLVAGLLAVVLFTLRVGHYLVVDDPLSQADAIVVLSSSAGRTHHAVHLFRQGYAPAVVFSDGTYKSVGLACSSAPLDVEAAQKLGLPADAAMITDVAQSTYDEAVNLRKLVLEHDWHSLIVVTDPFHTRRAGRTFRTLLPDVTVYLSAAPDPRYDPARWWESEHGLVAVLNEMVKLGFYWLKHGIAPF